MKPGRLLATAVLGVFVVACLVRALTMTRARQRAVGRQIGDVILPDESGVLVHLSSLRGHVVLLDLFAPW